MRFFRKRLPLDKAAERLAELAAFFGRQGGKDAIKFLQAQHDVAMSGEAEGRIIWHFSMFCYSWADRAALSELGIVRRNALMDRARPHFMQTFLELTDPTLRESSSFREHLERMLDEALLRWEGASIAPPNRDPLESPLVWEFAKEVAAIARRSPDPEAMMPVMIAAGACTEGIDATTVLDSIVWPKAH